MKPLSSSARRALIRFAYLLPVFSGMLLLIYALIPHLFFVYGDAIYNTQSPFELMQNTWKESQALLNGAEASAKAVMFSFTMSAVVILSWVFTAVYATVAIASAICSCIAFSHRPTEREANRAKRWMQFFCPNRVLYIIVNLLPLLPAAFPYILLHFYRTQMFYDMSLHHMGPPDFVLAAVAVLLNLAAFLLLMPAQNEEHMDMFRLYKAK